MNTQIEQVESLTQQAVQNVFADMVSMKMMPESPVPLPESPTGQIIASVGFIGEATGVIYLYVNVPFANVIACKMLGMELTDLEGEEMVNDAMGELSNMVVGHVKSHLQNGGLSCTLTIPSIVRGQQMSVEGSAQIAKKVIGFKDGEHHLLAEILLKSDS